MKNVFRWVGIIALVAVIGFSFAACKDDEEEAAVVAPTVINGYYGVTANGESMEVIITPASRATVEWASQNTYSIRVDGTEVSKGTAVKSGSVITFTSTDGSAVIVGSYDADGSPKVSVTKDGKTYTAQTMVTSSDYYYAYGAPTSDSYDKIQSNFKGKTPKQIYDQYLKNSDGDGDWGTWDYIVQFAGFYECPNSELSRISSEMNSGKISGTGYYTHSSFGNIVYYVSRISYK